jgi:hypothetical protein
MLQEIIKEIRDARLSPSQIQVAATEILSMKGKEVARDLFKTLNDEPGENVTANLLDLFHELAIRSATWTGILERSIKKRGKCPRRLVPTLREMFAAGDNPLSRRVRSMRDLLSDFETITEKSAERPRPSGVTVRQQGLFRPGRRSATVPMTMSLTDILHMEEMASIISDLKPTPDELILDFDRVEHVYVVGLAALAAWCRKWDVAPQIVNGTDSTLKYLETIGFVKASQGGISPYSGAHPDYAMAIERIAADTQPEAVASKLTDIVDHHMHLSVNARTGLIVVFAELIENIQRHAGGSSVAFACAQVYPKRRKLTVCVVDAGMGIRASIMAGSNEALVRRVLDGESPVRLACDPLITSKPDRHSGYGLYVASDLVVRNGGTFRLFSGNEVFTCYRTRWRRVEHFSEIPHGWEGTWVALILDLDARLSVEDVYLTLPPAPGAELQDFF